MVDALNKEAARVSGADLNPFRYDGVQVLLIRWDHDDLGVSPEVDALATVFDRDFGFGVSQLTIPVENSIHQLNRAILDWVEAYDHDGALLIIYYAGHGQISDFGRTLVWSNRRDEEDEYYCELRWNGCEDILLQAAADKLFISIVAMLRMRYRLGAVAYQK
ncbi:hypothetical protein B0T18DRAFT_391621 [Schizothecium vesticola]|uniref:Caspase family protein n=1 Tax=Schizothecium vesticola TaxID=314040 RepID=A0AA40ENQ9_9PEZI|nr:hypothetical protein B0T18DRAFT_391621 [Schizothecium vesticola]